MRKTSQDGGDSTSITSGLENDILKRPGALLIKTKKTSIKRKVQNLSESDDGVVEPLLQKDKERTESVNQSAKFLLSKTKTESTCEKGDDKDKLLANNQAETISMTSVPGITDNQSLANGTKDIQIIKSYASSAPIHNHMNTNVFSTHDGAKSVSTPKTQILVEIDGNKSYNPSPLIFTTAKIHTDGKTKPMEPVQVTPVPILSTIEGSVVKAGTAPDKLKIASGSVKKDDISSNLSAIASSKDRINISNYSGNNVTSYSGVPYKDILSTPDNKKPNTANKTTETILSAPITNVTDKITKVTSAVDYVKSITQLKSAVSCPISLPQTSYSTISETTRKTVVDKNLKSPPGTSDAISHSTNISKPANINDKIVPNSQTKLNTAVTREVEVDVNKNIQTVTNPDLQKPETSKETKLTVNIKDDEGISNKSKIYRNTSSSLSNKQFQRQKATVKEDINDSDTRSKQSVTKKDSTDTINKIIGNEKTQAKETDSDIFKNTKSVVCTPKPSAKSTIPVSKMSTASKTTAQSTIPTKPSILTSKVPSTVIKLTEVDIKTTSVATKTSNSPLITQTPNVASTGSVFKPSTTKLPTATSTNLVKTLSTAGIKSVPGSAITSSLKNTTTSIPKSTAATGQSQPTSLIKPLVVSTVKSTTNTSATKSPTSVTASNTSSALSKTSTVTTMKASITKAPSSTKVAQSKSSTSTTNTTMTALSNQSDPKTSDKSKDDKSKA